GYGLGSSKEVLTKFSNGYWKSSAHNFYISWVTDTGIIGLIAMLLLYFYTTKNLFLVRKKAMKLKNEELFIYSNMLLASFWGATVIFCANSFYAMDTVFFFFFSLSFVLLRLIKKNGKDISLQTKIPYE
ncbi:hypothetical protein ACFL0M_13575, partial [Thermodesulfobacteriota bacterium]